MKMMSRWTAVLAVLCLLVTLWTPVAVAAETPAPTAPAAAASQEELLYFGRSLLAKSENGEALCYAYDKLVAGCETIAEHIDIAHRTYEIDLEEARLVYRTVVNDHPEFFWLPDGMSMQGSSSKITAFRPYIYDGIAPLREQLAARVTELTADLVGKSDYDISRILHDRLADANTYRGNIDDQTAFGSLVRGESVCAGYARGYQLLMQTLGIPVFVVTGHSKGEAHAWNLVQLDGEWYYTDVTWDDQNDNGGEIYYAYLNLTYDRITEDHTATEWTDLLPRSTATAANYHVRNDAVMATPDVSRIAALLKKDGCAHICVTVDMADFVTALKDVLGDIVYEMTGEDAGYSCSLNYMGRELVLRVTVTHTHQYRTVTVGPTCIADGSVTVLCDTCGTVESTQTLPATGHTYVVTENVDATCAFNGYRDYACSECGVTYREILLATEHTPIPWSGFAPTCAQDGFSDGSLCSVCGMILVAREVIPAIGHDFSDMWNDSTYHSPQCNVCGDIIEWKEHTYEQDGKTCDTCGYVSKECHHHFLHPCGRFCTFCGEERLIDMAHTYDNDRDPDCNYCGEERYIAPLLYGDADGNGKVNNRDLGRLQQYLSGGDVTLDLDACDLDGNGRVNNRDLGRLQQYLSGWEIELG